MSEVNNRPLVSVIMPTYNCESYIESSVKSVISQTMKCWELIIVDDFGTDNTHSKIEPYIKKYSNIHYFRLEKNSGPSIARTEGLKRAKGKYIAFLDSDDLWMSDKLEKQIRFMENQDILFSCTAYSQMDEDGNDIGIVCYPPEKTDYKKMIRLSNPIGNLTVMFNREKLGNYEVPFIKKRNDFALWLKILKDTDACYGMDEILGVYRIRKNSVSSNKLSQAKYHWQLYREIEKLPLFYCCWAMLCWAWVKGTGIGLKRIKNKDYSI